MKWAWKPLVALLICLGLGTGSLPAGAGEMRAADARGYLEDLHEDLPVWVEAELSERDIPWRLITPANLKKIARTIATSTPRRFAECFFRNKAEHGGGPWRFYDLQVPSIEYPFNVVNESGHGTGKTREIEALLLHTLHRGGSVLYAAHSITARQEIWEDLNDLIRQSPFLRKVFPKSAIRQGNDCYIRGRAGNMARFKLTIRGGRQLHSIHVGQGYLLGDECDAWDEEAWSAFFSRAEDGTYVRCYSVPFKSTSTYFAKLAKRARSIELLRLASEGATANAAELGVDAFLEQIEFARVHWERPWLPTWSEAARLKAIERHGSEEGHRYQQYVLGRRVGHEDGVFRKGYLDKALGHVPGYRVVRAAYDLEHETVRASVYGALAGGGSIETLRRLHEVQEDDETFDLSSFVRVHFPASIPCDVVGVDVGRNRHPTEILFYEITPEGGVRLSARIQLLYVPTSVQGRLLGSIWHERQPEFGIGIEASGASHGQAVWDKLVDPREGKVPKVAARAYDWNETEPLLQKNGKPERDKHQRELRINAREAATRVIEELLERQKSSPGFFELHDDPDVRREFESHLQVGETAYGRKFSQHDDHLVDATRAALKKWADARRRTRRGRPRIATTQVSTPRDKADQHPARTRRVRRAK